MDHHPSRLDSLKSSVPSSSSSSVSSLTTSGLGSLHGSSEEMSETSDYQRSTPSPRDQVSVLIKLASYVTPVPGKLAAVLDPWQDCKPVVCIINIRRS